MDKAHAIGMFGYVDPETGLYKMDFLCSNCLKSYDNVTFGFFPKVCECGLEFDWDKE